MGNGFSLSQATLFGTSDLTEEVQQSLNQIIQAFDHEFSFETRRQKRPQPSPIMQSPNTQQVEETIHHSSHHRSRSLDQYQLEEHHRTAQTSLSTIRRQWQCQLCHTKNESDALICTDCGSNKINVYIPIMDHMNGNQRLNNTSIQVPNR